MHVLTLYLILTLSNGVTAMTKIDSDMRQTAVSLQVCRDNGEYLSEQLIGASLKSDPTITVKEAKFVCREYDESHA